MKIGWNLWEGFFLVEWVWKLEKIRESTEDKKKTNKHRAMLKIRKFERSDVMGLKLLERAYITILGNKESFFCLRKWVIVITMAKKVFVFGMFQRAIRSARLSIRLNSSRTKPIIWFILDFPVPSKVFALPLILVGFNN